MKMINNKKWKVFLKALAESGSFNIDEREQGEYYQIPRKFYNSIMNWARVCTKPKNHYQNPESMYVALNLIYLLLDCIKEHQSLESTAKKGEA